MVFELNTYQVQFVIILTEKSLISYQPKHEITHFPENLIFFLGKMCFDYSTH